MQCKTKQLLDGTLLHEFGHSTYDRYKDFNLPFVVRDPAHTFTTEAIAMMLVVFLQIRNGERHSWYQRRGKNEDC